MKASTSTLFYLASHGVSMLHEFCLLLGAFAMAYFGQRLANRHHGRKENVIDATNRFSRGKQVLKAYAKPSSKSAPKINDDFKSWRKENDLPTDD